MKVTKQSIRRHPLRHLWYWLTRYTVVMRWCDGESVRFAKTYDEALQWTRCYPMGAVIMIGKRGKLIAARY